MIFQVILLICKKYYQSVSVIFFMFSKIELTVGNKSQLMVNFLEQGLRIQSQFTLTKKDHSKLKLCFLDKKMKEIIIFGKILSFFQVQKIFILRIKTDKHEFFKKLTNELKFKLLKFVLTKPRLFYLFLPSVQ